MVVLNRVASITYLQRTLELRYTMAAALLRTMEQHGIVSSLSGRGKRTVLVGKDPSLLDRLFGRKPRYEPPSVALSDAELLELLNSAVKGALDGKRQAKNR